MPVIKQIIAILVQVTIVSFLKVTRIGRRNSGACALVVRASMLHLSGLDDGAVSVAEVGVTLIRFWEAIWDGARGLKNIAIRVLSDAPSATREVSWVPAIVIVFNIRKKWHGLSI